MSDTLSCRSAMALATARRVGIGDADSLRLESHLATCATCVAEVALLDRLVAVALERPTTKLRAGETRPYFDRALRRALAGERPRAALPASRPTGAVGTVVAAAAAFLLAVVGIGSLGTPPAAVVAAPARPSGHALATSTTRLSVAHGTLLLAPGSEVTWEGSVVRLLAGRVHVEVDPTAHLPFRVETERFAVSVVGTRFDVHGTGVAVFAGSVRVWSPTGVLLSTLHAGDRWELVDAPVTTAALDVAPPAVAAIDEVTEDVPVPRVRREVEPAASRFARASTLEASDPAAADALYAELEHEGGAWGQNALFARASLLLHRGRADEGRRLLERYLRLHPDGANAEDARALLGE